MQGKTHFFIGIAAAVSICRPQTAPMLIAGTAAAGIGGVISDIDSGGSSAHHEADQITAVIVTILAGVGIADLNLHLGISRMILTGISHTRQVSILLMLIAICALGKATRHRTFMHSIAAGLLLSGGIYLMVPALAPYFAVAFASHLLLDLLNRKKVRLFWPAKKGYCLGLCNSSGRINGLLLAVGMAAAVLAVWYSVPVRNTGYALQSLLQEAAGKLNIFGG